MKTKNIIKTIILIAIALVIVGLPSYMIVNDNIEKKYCGRVCKMYTTGVGYKAPAEKHIIFFCHSLQRNIDVKVSNQCFANTEVGKNVCFDLNRLQLEE